MLVYAKIDVWKRSEKKIFSVNRVDFDMEKFKNFCNKYQLKFPQEFVEYLKQYNDAELEPNYLDFGANACGIRYFYGTSGHAYCDIEWNYEIYKTRMPEKCIPIADEDCGNQICMSLAEDTYGKIYFWEHETMDTDDREECQLGFDDMYELASSFSDLLDKLEESPYEYEIEEEKHSFFKRVLNVLKGK